MPRNLAFVLALIVCIGCGDDGTASDAGLSASGATTTSPSTFPAAADTDSGARATGGVFEAPATQPARR